MKKIVYFSAIFTAMLILVGCGSGGNGSLEGKVEELKKLREDYAVLGQKIADLEAEVSELDTNAVEANTSVPVRVMPLKEGTFQHFVKVQGQVTADDNIIVSPKAPGSITRVYVDEGQVVSRGQLLAQVDTMIVAKSLAELYTQLNLATTLYDKQARLWKQKIGTEVQLLQAKTQKEALEKRIATTREQLKQSRITAPIGGFVEKSFVKQGETAVPGMPAFRLVNLAALAFEANISESYIPYIKQGDAVKINFPTANEVMDAKVSSVSQTINPQNRTVLVRVKLPGRHDKLKANMVGEIEINDLTHENMIIIPMEFVQKSADGSFVMTAEKNEAGEYVAKRMSIETGQSYQGNIEVTKGLRKDFMLITDGQIGLTEGQTLAVQGTNKQ